MPQALDVRVGYDRFKAVDSFKAVEGEKGLIMFQTLAHGALMNIASGARTAKRYTLGTQLVAAQMIGKDTRVGLYAPPSSFLTTSKRGSSRACSTRAGSRSRRLGPLA